MECDNQVLIKNVEILLFCWAIAININDWLNVNLYERIIRFCCSFGKG